MRILEAAQSCLQAGLCVLPAIPGEKRPALAAWKDFQARLPTEQDVARWFPASQGLCLICGTVSGNLEMLDFDLGGEAFQVWYDRIRQADAALLERLVIEESPSGGWHAVYRSQEPICGNLKLAQRKQLVPGPDEITIAGKAYKPRQDAEGRWHVLLTLIETRGEGGLFLCAPTPGYELLQGDFTQLPTLTPAERDLLLQTAWALNEYVPEPVQPALSSGEPSDGRPGDDYNARGNVRDVLVRHGWTLVKGGDNEYWRRPGKPSGWSATLKDGVFYVFSSSAAPFEPNRAYSSFAVYALLEHGGDFAAAASALRAQGLGGDVQPQPDVDLSRLLARPSRGETAEHAEDSAVDPGPIPEEMLRVPGFISELMDLCMATAPYPNQPMTFCGGLALQAFLAGRKVCDPGDNRTNIYLLGLAHSSAGKDWIRKLNAKILHEVGLLPCLGDRLASGEGVQDALLAHPSMLFQTDEIDGILQSINRAKDARHESIMNTLLSLYSSANSVFAMRPKAGKPDPGVIDQPSLVLFGTAIPNHYYEALSERMLTNGFFARQLVVESGRRQQGQEPGIISVSPTVLATAKWWADFRPGAGNLQHWHPVPVVIEHTVRAKERLIDIRNQAESEYAKAEERGDPVGTTVWGRVSEQTRKLALLYAVSENHLSPRIGAAAVEWASRFVLHQTRRMLYMATLHVSESEFDHRCKRLLEVLLEWAAQHDDPWMPYREITRRLRWSRREHDEVRQALIDQERIEVETRQTGGRPRFVYRAPARRKPPEAE